LSRAVPGAPAGTGRGWPLGHRAGHDLPSWGKRGPLRVCRWFPLDGGGYELGSGSGQRCPERRSRSVAIIWGPPATVTVILLLRCHWFRQDLGSDSRAGEWSDNHML
jgi:hypothetical protein